MLTDKEQNQLIYESMRIVAGETMTLPTRKHLQALLEERTDTIAALGTAHDALVDAKSQLYGKTRDGVKAIIADTKDELKRAGFLSELDPNWASKVIRTNVL